MAYEVRCEVFAGPIDLLLHLITRQRVDIYDVSLATITEEYLAAIAGIDECDLESATGFLVVAATLLELKSLRLLPARTTDDSDARLLEERDLLLARLVECSTFREAGAWIAARLQQQQAFHPRVVALDAAFVGLVPDLLARTGVDDIARAAAAVLAPKPEVELDTSHVAPITASVKEAIVALAGRLRAAPALSFERLCEPTATRIDVIVHFLALLELFKAGAIELAQADRFGDIEARWTGEVDAQEVVEDAEEYALEGGDTR